MAQEKISFNAALMSLPLQADPARLSRCDCRDVSVQPWDIDNRYLVELPTRWQPGFFFVRKGDADSAKFVVRFYNAVTNTLAKTITSAQLSGIKVYRTQAAAAAGAHWDKVVIPASTNLTVDLPTGVYYLTVAGLTSELFRVVTYSDNDRVPPVDHLQFSLSNPAPLSEVPYQTGYVQTFGLAGSLCAGAATAYTESSKSERFGDKITYSRQYRVWTLDYPEVSEPMAALLKSFEQHEQVIIRDRHKTLTIPGDRITVTLKEDTCCTLSVSLEFQEIISEWGTCKADLLTEETGLATAQANYQDPADSDPDFDYYTPDITAEPVTTPDTTVPAAGTLLVESKETSDCGDPFIDITTGLRYREMTTIARADGNGGQTNEFLFANPCPLNPLTVPVPTIPGLVGPVFLRAGRPISQIFSLAGLFGPARGQTQPPTVTITGLPSGVTYSGGRLVGTPTTPGDVTATARVAAPGGGSIEVPFTVSTAGSAPTVLDANLTVYAAYNEATSELTVTITSSFTPEVKQTGLGSTVVGWVTASAADQTDTWTVIFSGVSTSGRINLRQAGSSGEGVSFPISIFSSTANPTNPTTPGSTTDTLDVVAKRGTTDQIGKTDQILKLLGGLFLSSVPVSTSAAQTMLTLDPTGRVYQQVLKNLLTLAQQAAIAYPNKPSGDIPDIDAILFAGMNEANAAMIAQKLTGIGFTGSTGTGTGTTGSWTVTGKRCFKRSLTSILDESITNSHLTAGAVSYDKTDFVRSGTNLYNKNSLYNKAGQYMTDGGVSVVNPDYSISHPIPAVPFGVYTPSGPTAQYIAFFDPFGVSLGGASYTRTNLTVIAPAGTAYLRATIATASKASFMLVEGPTLPGSYQDFELVFSGKTAGELALSNQLETTRLSLARGSVNLYDQFAPDAVQTSYIDNLGNYTADSANSVSGLIAVQPATTYTPGYKTFVAYYDANRNVTGAGALFNRSTDSFQTDASTRYIRITVPNTRKTTFMLVEGTRLPVQYVPYQSLLDSIVPFHQTAIDALDIASNLNALIPASINLFDKDSITRGVIMDTSGNLGQNQPLYGLSGYISVDPETDYIASNKQYITFFDSTQTAIPGPIGAYDRASLTVHTPANAAYVRLTVALSTLDQFQFQQGAVVTTYQPFVPVARLTTAQGSEALSKVNRVSSLFTPTKNLIDKNAVTPGYYIDNAGVLSPLSAYSVSDYTPLDPGQTYIINDKEFFTLYDKNKGVITSNVGLLTRPLNSFVTPAGTAFGRFTLANSLLNSVQLELGSVQTSYSIYGQVTSKELVIRNSATGKIILWLGTSIPAGETQSNTFANPGSYPNLACALLGATCINQAIPSSSYRIFDKNGTYGGMNWQNAAFSVGHTLSEKNAFISNWSTIRTQFANGSSSPTTLSSADQTFIRACSYENKLKPYLDGTYPAPDAIVFAAPYNDVENNETEGEYTAIPNPTDSRNTAIGAINYLINFIHSYQPRMKIAFEGHYENQLITKPALAQAVLATYWGYPLWKLWDESGFSQRIMPNSGQYWDQSPWSSYKSGAGAEAVVGGVNQNMTALRFNLPDRVHPSSDTSGNATQVLAVIVRNHLTELF